MKTIHAEPAVPTANTMTPRYAAAVLDNALALALSMACALLLDGNRVVQVFVLVGAYLGYFSILEGLTGRTLGKLLTGLVVLQFDGTRCNWRQSAVRTLFRLLEVNPLLFGYLPAALSIIFSPYRQRFGDKMAGTVVAVGPPRRSPAPVLAATVTAQPDLDSDSGNT